MNAVTLIGKLCREHELKYTTTGTAVLENAIAVRREAKNKDGEYESDFVSFTLFGKTAEFLSKYSDKGDTICLIGRLRTDKYTNKEGETKYKQYIRGSSVEIIKHKDEKQIQPQKEAEQMSINEEELPF